MGKGQDLYRKAKTIIPGGTQLLSKRPEMFLPDIWPAYYSRSEGCEVWDLDNNHYYDFSYMGIGACPLGYADQEVNTAVIEAVGKGNMNTLNPPEEVELAELLIGLHPWAQMVRYARSGGEAMAIAVRIARAFSRKDTILFCGYHGWSDWYLASNLSDQAALDGHLLPGLLPLGVPRGLKGTAIPFHFNDTQEFLNLWRTHRHRIGAIVMEPLRNTDPRPDFLQAVNQIAQENQIPLVIDEITAGFRLCLGGAHLLYEYKPDIAIFAKGISNGFPMAAVIGKRGIMQKAQDSFISSTYWTDRIGPSAALATIKKMGKTKAQAKLIQAGKAIKKIWAQAADQASLSILISGIDPLCRFGFDCPEPSVLKTLFTQLMLEKGFLASTAFYASFAHNEETIAKYKQAVLESFSEIKRLVTQNQEKKALKGPICHSGFQRLN